MVSSFQKKGNLILFIKIKRNCMAWMERGNFPFTLSRKGNAESIACMVHLNMRRNLTTGRLRRRAQFIHQHIRKNRAAWSTSLPLTLQTESISSEPWVDFFGGHLRRVEWLLLWLQTQPGNLPKMAVLFWDALKLQEFSPNSNFRKECQKPRDKRWTHPQKRSRLEMQEQLNPLAG